VRWATEDPNPVQKVLEKRRLEGVGKEAVRARMDVGVVDAMRAVRALEEGVVLDEDGNWPVEEGEGAPPASKKQRMAIEDGSEDEEVNSSPPTPTEPPKLGSILSADALEGLKYFAEIRKRSAESQIAAPKKRALPAAGGGLTLGDYGSDDDD